MRSKCFIMSWFYQLFCLYAMAEIFWKTVRLEENQGVFLSGIKRRSVLPGTFRCLFKNVSVFSLKSRDVFQGRIPFFSTKSPLPTPSAGTSEGGMSLAFVKDSVQMKKISASACHWYGLISGRKEADKELMHTKWQLVFPVECGDAKARRSGWGADTFLLKQVSALLCSVPNT